VSAFSRARAALLSGFLLLALVSTASARTPHVSRSTSYKSVCAKSKPGFMHCDAAVAVHPNGKIIRSAAAFGFAPADLQSAYGLTAAASTSGGDQTIAIIDAYDEPRAEADLGVYRARFGLPPCTTANGCFRKLDQNGGASYPRADSSWGQEMALDLDMASALCPHCKLMLVEASSPSATDLAKAANTAATLGATQISNSYGGPEFPSESYYDTFYNHSGVAVFASSGDSGYGVQYPAASPVVTSVGGTSLQRDGSGRGWTESAWSGAGSGCSAYIPKPAWQTDTGCAMRSVADVSAVADPGTGVAVYDSDGAGGWGVYGGTSAAAPIVAGVYALVGRAAGANYGGYAYQNRSLFYDVTSGSNGNCGTFYMCNGGAGYDGPTGLGTPNGAIATGTAPAQGTVQPVSTGSLPAVRISRRTVKATRGGTLRVRINCPFGAACRGQLVLRTTLRSKTNTTVAIGQRGFYVPAGRDSLLLVHLTKRVRALLLHHPKLRVIAAASVTDASHSSGSAIFQLRSPWR
jgi:subtilase family serine protease